MKRKSDADADPAEPEPALLQRVWGSHPHNVTSASGSYLELGDGRKILDGCAGAAVALLGHGNAEVAAAAAAQTEQVSYVHTMLYSTQAAEDLARCILAPHPSSPGFRHGLTKAYWTGSGSEANEAALKCARQYFFVKGEMQRTVYVARKMAYHGSTVGAMSVSGMLARKVPYEGILLPNVEFVGAADAFHRKGEAETEEEFVERLVGEIKDVFVRRGPENIISFIGETVSGAALGAMAAPKGYWPAVRALCDEYGILLHLDEVMCGMGRTGTYFAFEKEGIKPDIVTIGKGLAGGYAAIAGMLVNDKIFNVLRKGTSTFNHGHTFQSHPVSCAIALKVQQIVKRDRLVEACVEKGMTLRKLLHAAFAGAEYVADIRGDGLFWAVEFMQDPASKTPFAKEVGFSVRTQLATLDCDVAVYLGTGAVDGVRGDHLLVAPPFTVSDAELEIVVEAMRKAYDGTVAELYGPRL